MKVTLTTLLLLNMASAQQLSDVMGAVNASSILDLHDKVIKPIQDVLEPYKTHESTFERGVPEMHEDLGKLSFELS